MKRILLIMALMFSTGAFAGYETCDIGNTGLPDSVVQKLKADCEVLRLEQLNKKAAEKNNVLPEAPTITPERVTGWAQVAEGFANAMGAAAKQLNISVNDFIKTPAGLITIGVILWKVIGVSILKLMAMYFVFILGLNLVKAMWKVDTIPVEKSFLWWKWTKHKNVYSTWASAKESQCGMTFVVMAVCGVAELSLLLSLT